MIRLSIIVPFYNVEKYIEQCIRSLYDQDIPKEEYEVICVDDCSPDSSRAIVEQLQTEFSTLQLITHEKNKKQGGARNTGLRAAKGEYIWFVDSDDFAESHCLKKLINEAEMSCIDILHFDKKVYQFGKCIQKSISYDDEKIYTGMQFILDKNNKSRSCYPMVWCVFYKRTLLIDNKLFFEENVQFEDTDFALRVFMKAERVKHSNTIAYNYIVHNQSATHSIDSPMKMVYQVLLLSRSVNVLILCDNIEYSHFIEDYVRKESYQLGKRIIHMPFTSRLKYMVTMQGHKIYSLFKYTSLRNFFRLKFAIGN